MASIRILSPSCQPDQPSRAAGIYAVEHREKSVKVLIRFKFLVPLTIPNSRLLIGALADFHEQLLRELKPKGKVQMNFMQKCWGLGLAALCTLSGSAYAGLVPLDMTGYSLRVENRFPNYATVNETQNFVVGAGIEAINIQPVDATNLDISGSTIQFIFSRGVTWVAANWVGPVISDYLDSVPDFANVTLDSVTGNSGFNTSRLSFDADHINLNWQNLTFASGDTITLSVSSNSTSVPEPAPLVLLGTGLAALLVGRRAKA